MNVTLEQLASPESTLADFIAFYEAIPDERWYSGGWFSDPTDASCKCALGHLSADSDSHWRLVELTRPGNVVQVNDGENPRYPQPTPKARVLEFLRDIERRSK